MMGRPTSIPNGHAADAAKDVIEDLELVFPPDTPDGPPSDEDVYALMGGNPPGPSSVDVLPLDRPSLPDALPEDAMADVEIGGMAPGFVFGDDIL